MHRIIVLIVFLAVAAPVIAGGSGNQKASAEQPDKNSTSGEIVVAQWDFAHADGGLTRLAFFSDIPWRQPPPECCSTFIDVIDFDSQGTIVRQVIANARDVVTEHESHLYGRADAAYVQASVPAVDCPFQVPYGEPVPAECSQSTLHVSLSWMGDDPLLVGHVIQRSNEEVVLCRLKNFEQGASRFGVAEGVITDGIEDFTRGTPSSYAVIGRFTTATTTHGECLEF